MKKVKYSLLLSVLCIFVSVCSYAGTFPVSLLDMELQFAVRSRNDKEVLLLLQQGANPNALYGRMPIACWAAFDASILKVFLQYGVSPDCICFDMSMLHMVSSDSASILLQFGADPNNKDGDGITPLMSAVLSLGSISDYNNEQLQVIKILLQNGANPYLKNKEGETALDIAIRRNKSKAVEILQKYMNK